MATYNYTKLISVGILTEEIKGSNITSACLGVTLRNADSVQIEFDNTLSAEDETTLNNIVGDHEANPTSVGRAGTHNLLTFEKSAKTSTWKRCSAYIYEGVNEISAPYEMELIGYCDKNTIAEVRIFNKTDGVQITSVTFNNTEEEQIRIPVENLSWPDHSVIMEVQVRRSSGNGKVYANGMVVGY